ncbi:MAG: PEGA domain-containing protein [Deltaproteobacteria bacterium]|nr:PEGA domain-containing protein [Deltaproteobacteria bacterium]
MGKRLLVASVVLAETFSATALWADAPKIKPVQVFVFGIEAREPAAASFARSVNDALESEMYGSPEWVQAPDEPLKREPVDESLKIAETRRSRGEAQLADALARIAAHDDRAALDRLADAEAHFTAALAVLGDLTPLETIFRERALASFREGEDRAGEKALERLFVLNPKGLATVANPPPVLARIAERVRRRVGEPTTLRVVTEPAGAQVFIDGVPRGVAPVSVPNLLPGVHTFRLLKDRFAVAAGVVNLDRKGGTLTSRLVPLTVPPGRWYGMLLRAKLRRGTWDDEARKAAVAVARALHADALVVGDAAIVAKTPTVTLRLLALKKSVLIDLGEIRAGPVAVAKAVVPFIDKVRRVIFPGVGAGASGTSDKEVGRLERELEIEDLARAGRTAPLNGGSAWYRKWWVWTLVGIAAAAAGTATTLLLTRDRGSPTTTLNVTWSPP